MVVARIPNAHDSFRSSREQPGPVARERRIFNARPRFASGWVLEQWTQGLPRMEVAELHGIAPNADQNTTAVWTQARFTAAACEWEKHRFWGGHAQVPEAGGAVLGSGHDSRAVRT